MAFLKASQQELKKELAAAIDGSTWLSQLADDIPAEVVDLWERLGARGTSIRVFIEALCVSLGPTLQGLVENFRAGLNKSVDEAFCAGSVGS